MSLYEHIPHEHIEQRKEIGPVKVHDQLRNDSWYKRVNAKIAIWITVGVGSMTCAWLFAILAIAGLPTALKPGNIGLLFWISSDFLQLTLLSVILVGQNIQAKAADNRAELTYKDAEAVLAEALKIQDHLVAQDEALTRLIDSEDQVLTKMIDFQSHQHNVVQDVESSPAEKTGQLPMQIPDSPGRVRFGEEHK